MEEKDASDDGDALIAGIIAGDKAPPWLVLAVSKARATLAWTIKKEREYPHRKELRARLKKLADAVQTVRAAMYEDFDLMIMLRAGDDFILNENETFHGLGDLAERTRKTLAAVPARKGKDKYFWRSEGATPRQNCALMVSILWERVRSAAPPKSNVQAQEACAALWAAAGGLVERDGKIVGKWGTTRVGASVSVWRDHLRAAKLLSQSEEAKFLRRSLSPKPDEAWERASAAEIGIIRSSEG
jgi:hypothetical protein